MSNLVGWTQADIDKLKAAIAEGVLIVSYDGPPKRTIQYQQLPQMRDLLASMVKCVNETASPSHRVANHRKGFFSDC